MTPDFAPNYVAIVVAGLAAWALGAIWYSALFQKPWLKEMGFTQEMLAAGAAKGGMKKTMIGGALSAMVTAWVMSYDVAAWKVDTVAFAIPFAFCIWLGYVAMVQLDSVLYERRSWKLFFINTSYRLCAVMITAVVLALWK